MVRLCESLTGAYLGEVAHRVKVHGIKNYRSEIKSIVAAAPRDNGHQRRYAIRYKPRKRSNKRTARQIVNKIKKEFASLPTEARKVIVKAVTEAKDEQRKMAVKKKAKKKSSVVAKEVEKS